MRKSAQLDSNSVCYALGVFVSWIEEGMTSSGAGAVKSASRVWVVREVHLRWMAGGLLWFLRFILLVDTFDPVYIESLWRGSLRLGFFFGKWSSTIFLHQIVSGKRSLGSRVSLWHILRIVVCSVIIPFS